MLKELHLIQTCDFTDLAKCILVLLYEVILDDELVPLLAQLVEAFQVANYLAYLGLLCLFQLAKLINFGILSGSVLSNTISPKVLFPVLQFFSIKGKFRPPRIIESFVFERILELLIKHRRQTRGIIILVIKSCLDEFEKTICVQLIGQKCKIGRVELERKGVHFYKLGHCI